MKKLLLTLPLLSTISLSANASANSLNTNSYWQHYVTTSSASFQSTSGTAAKSGSSHQVSGQNLYLDTVTAGRLGNSTYFAFMEAIVGKLNGTDNGPAKTPYGRELLEYSGMFSQQWHVTPTFQLGWNYYGIDRDIRFTETGKFGYSLGSVGLTAGYNWDKWSFTPVLNYVFSAKLGKDGLGDLGESEFQGFFFYPRISGKIASNGTRLMLGSEYFNGANSEDTDVEYLKGVAKLTSPIGNSKKWSVTGKLTHISYFSFDYFGIDINPHQETSVSFGVQYNW